MPRSFSRLRLAVTLGLLLGSLTNRAADSEKLSAALTSAEVLAQSPDSDWRLLDPERTAYLDLPHGLVVIELAPGFAPRHQAQLRQLLTQHYFDQLPILRVQDNYVVQWGDPQASDPARAKSRGDAGGRLNAEFDIDSATALHFTPLGDRDVYAEQVGFIDGFHAARDAVSGRTWLTHCYGALGAGRDNAADSGSAAELYVVIGHAPRHLDRNVTLLGRVVKGMELLASLPRGSEAMGFLADPAKGSPIRRFRLANDIAESERSALQVMRTDSPSFRAWIASRRSRHEEWFVNPVGRIELCNVQVPVREARP